MEGHFWHGQCRTVKGALSAQTKSVGQFLWNHCSCLQEICSYEKQLKTAHHFYKRFLFSSYLQILRLLQFLVLGKMGRARTSLTGLNPSDTRGGSSQSELWDDNGFEPGDPKAQAWAPALSLSPAQPCGPAQTLLCVTSDHVPALVPAPPDEGIWLIAPVHLSNLFIPWLLILSFPLVLANYLHMKFVFIVFPGL